MWKRRHLLEQLPSSGWTRAHILRLSEIVDGCYLRAECSEYMESQAVGRPHPASWALEQDALQVHEAQSGTAHPGLALPWVKGVPRKEAFIH